MQYLDHIFLEPISMSAIEPKFYSSPWKGMLHRAKMLGPVRQQRKAEVTGEGAPGGASEESTPSFLLPLCSATDPPLYAAQRIDVQRRPSFHSGQTSRSAAALGGSMASIKSELVGAADNVLMQD